jgi:hypothetical protein
VSPSPLRDVLEPGSIDMGDLRLTKIIEMADHSPLEGKFRRDIDVLLGEPRVLDEIRHIITEDKRISDQA